MTSAAPRSRPIPLSIPRNAAAAHVTIPEDAAKTAVPTAPTSASRTSERRRPARSAPKVARSAARAAPVSPAEITSPIAAPSNPIFARWMPRRTPIIPVARARRKADPYRTLRSLMTPGDTIAPCGLSVSSAVYESPPDGRSGRLLLPLRRDGPLLRDPRDETAHPGLRLDHVRSFGRSVGVHDGSRARLLRVRPRRRPRREPRARLWSARDRDRTLCARRAAAPPLGRASLRPDLGRRVLTGNGRGPHALRRVARHPSPAHDSDGRDPSRSLARARAAGRRNLWPGRKALCDQHVRSRGRNVPRRLRASSTSRRPALDAPRGGGERRTRDRSRPALALVVADVRP